LALVLAVAAASAAATVARATVEMQKEAKKLGFAVRNCLHCHATPHAVDEMKEKARELGMSDGNCLLCHGADIPTALNDRGEFLVSEKARREADRFEMKWLADYVEPSEGEDAEEEGKPSSEE
jgi:hypothetical protein